MFMYHNFFDKFSYGNCVIEVIKDNHLFFGFITLLSYCQRVLVSGSKNLNGIVIFLTRTNWGKFFVPGQSSVLEVFDGICVLHVMLEIERYIVGET